MAVDTSYFENYTAELLNQSLTRGVSYSSVSLDQENFSMNIDRWIYLGSPSSTIGILHYELIYNEKDKSYEVQNISFVS